MSREIGDAFNFMRHDMMGKLTNYRQSLEHRYGDPAVYEMQREEMAAEQAVVEHRQARTREEALRLAYEKNRAQTRQEHESRWKDTSRDRPPQYVEPDPDLPTGHTGAPPAPPRPPSARPRRAPRSAAAR